MTDDQQREAVASLLRECDLATADMRKWVRVPVTTVRAALAPVQPDPCHHLTKCADAACAHRMAARAEQPDPQREYAETVDWLVDLGVLRSAAEASLAWTRAVQPDPLRAGVEALAKLDALGADLDLLADVVMSGIPADTLRYVLQAYAGGALRRAEGA